MKNAPEVDDPVIKPHGGCRANHWESGGAALGIPPLQELKKKTGQRVKLRSPYRKGRRPANSVCSIPYVRGVPGAQLEPHAGHAAELPEPRAGPVLAPPPGRVQRAPAQEDAPPAQLDRACGRVPDPLPRVEPGRRCRGVIYSSARGVRS